MTIRWSTDSPAGEITLRIPASALAASMHGLLERKSVPETVTQENVFELFGLRSKTYLRFARAGRFPNNKIGSLRVALYEDVRAFLTARPDLSGQPLDSALNMSNVDHVSTLQRMVRSIKNERG